MLRTRLTEMFCLERPIVLAPLGAGATSAHLASAVSEAGGLGMFGGTHPRRADWVREQSALMRARTRRPWGVGFITWSIPAAEAGFQACLDERIPIVAFSFGDPTPYVTQAKAGGARVLCQVQTIESARVALAISDAYKKCIVESDGQDTVFTSVYDIMYAQRFPEGIAGRARVNRFTREWHGREAEVRQRREELAAQVPARSVLERDPEVHPIWMGQSAGAVPGVRSVSEVIAALCDDAERLLRERARTLLA